MVFSNTFDEHLQHLDAVLARFAQHGLKIKLEKSNFAAPRIHFLGHVVDGQTIRPLDKNVEPVRLMPDRLRDITEVQRFLGLVNFYRRFIPKLAHVAIPLYRLLSYKKSNKPPPFVFTAEHENAVREIKQLLTTEPCMLYLPDLNRPFRLDTDASEIAAGAVLCQEIDGKDRVIGYFSRAFNDAQKKYAPTLRECLAAVWGVQHFRCYLQNGSFTLVTDHSALKTILDPNTVKQSTNPMLTRWALELQGHSFRVIHRPGSAHSNADALSRLPIEYHPQKRQPVLAAIEVAASSAAAPDHSAPMQIDPPPSTAISSRSSGALVRNPLRDSDYPAPIEHRALEPTSSVLLDLLRTHQRHPPSKYSEMIAVLEGTKGIENLSSKDSRDYYMQEKNTLFLDSSGILCKAIIEPQSDARRSSSYRAVYVVPPAMTNTAIRACHDDLYAGHRGVLQTLERLQTRFAIENPNESVRAYVQACTHCQQAKRGRAYSLPLLSGPLPVAPLDIIAIDFVTGLPHTRLGFNSLLVVVDVFSRFGWFLPTKERSGHIVLDVLHDQVFTRFGFPNFILSDRAPEFIAGPLKRYSKAGGIKQLRTSGYHPQSNGAVERLVGTFSELLRSCATDNPASWPVLAPVFAYAYNTAWHRTLAVTPFRIMFGRDPNELDGLPHVTPPGDTPGDADLVHELQWRQYFIHQLVYRHLNKLRQQRSLLNASAHFPSFQEGDLVYIHRRPGIFLRRISARRLGPYIITHVINDLTYVVDTVPESPVPFAANESRVYHVSHLSPYRTLDDLHDHSFVPSASGSGPPLLFLLPHSCTRNLQVPHECRHLLRLSSRMAWDREWLRARIIAAGPVQTGFKIPCVIRPRSFLLLCELLLQQTIYCLMTSFTASPSHPISLTMTIDASIVISKPNAVLAFELHCHR